MKRSIIIALVALAALTTTAQADWTDELTDLLRGSKVSGERNIRVSHCGKVRNSTLSRSIREVWSGARPRIKQPKKEGGPHTIKFIYKNTLIKRNVQFVCHHSG